MRNKNQEWSKIIAILLAFSILTNFKTSTNNRGKNNENDKEDFHNFLAINKYASPLDALKNYEITYLNEDYYLSLEYINSLIAKAKNNPVYNHKDISVDNAFDAIRINSENLSEDLFEDNLFSNTLKRELANIKNNSTNDVLDDLCHLTDLKIVNLPIAFDAYSIYDENSNTLIIDLVKIKSKENPKEILKETLDHELNHVRQVKCNHNKNAMVSINYADFNTILLETSAESAMLHNGETKDETYIYYNERKDETLLFLLGMFKKGNTADNYYNAIFNSDLNALWSFYDLNSPEEIYDFYRMLYSIDSKNLRTPLIKDLANTTTDATYFDVINTVGLSYKLDLYKSVLIKLANFTIDEDLSLEDNLILLNIINSIICEKITLNNNTQVYPWDDADFNANFNRLTFIYHDFLREYYHLDQSFIGESKPEYIDALNALIRGYDYPNKEIKTKAEELLKRFPLLRDIMKNHYIVIETKEPFKRVLAKN
ncbi:MAG: hypothetical protein NC483_02085 [Ruminococcus sp.]|nr:hypothetical protein [Ruminococcus sp.]